MVFWIEPHLLFCFLFFLMCVALEPQPVMLKTPYWLCIQELFLEVFEDPMELGGSNPGLILVQGKSSPLLCISPGVGTLKRLLRLFQEK